MISRVFRDPVGLDSGKHPVREGDQAAVLRDSNGGDVPSGVENAPGNRIPEAKITYTSPNGSARGSRRNHKESLRRLEGIILPVRKESEGHGHQEDEERYGILDKTRSSHYRGSRRRKKSETNGVQASSGSTGVSQKAIDGTGGENPGSGSISEGEKEITKRCFLNIVKCTPDCMAYSASTKEKCRLLMAVDTIIRPRHSYPAPPKVMP